MMKLLTLLLLVLLPFVFGTSKFILTILNLTMIHAIAAVGLNLIMGYTGQVSIGHAAFMSIGAYTSALLAMKLSIPLALSIPIAVLVSGIFGFIFGFPSLRLTGFYLAITTMGFAVAVEQLLGAWKDLTKGHIGLRGVPKLGSELFNYYVILAVVVLCFYAFTKLTSHKTGRALKAIRENPLVARVFGINLTKYKLLAFTVGSAFAGLAGALYAHEIGYLAPSVFGLGKSLELLAIVVVGGMGLAVGPFFGSVVYTVLPFLFSRSGISLSIIFGIILIATVLFMPRGIAYYAQNFWLKYGELPVIFLKRRKKSKEGYFVQLPFGKLHCVEEGQGEKVLLCIHGNFGSWRWFKPLMEELKDRYRFLAVDLPNFGDSSRTKSSLEFYAEAVKQCWTCQLKKENCTNKKWK
ncbi:alpha/beta fold hydrolase [Pseudothermotoga thermarum]|uniref:Inner-membrane translocator n=1 Tax=Pseudothermotoga thermarum DSM 5069 TaxID=688269 RepID=F7YUC6_9THEM|nr:alpha/beta fold hydrolase [Pseudothermotoga thermarum]AEH51325.1 inner-membrane translocator [Pseudothermotoga thermarum DSM 5069]